MTKEEVDAAIAVVEGSISWLEGWVIPFAWLVAIGVAGEAFLGVKQLLNNRELHRLRVVQTELVDKERAKLQTEVSKAQKGAAEARLALERFKGPRRLVSDAQARIAEKLKSLSPLSINLLEFDGQTNAEVADLGSDLRETILRIPNSTAHISIASSITPFASGIIVRAKRPLGDTIANALKSEGLSVVWPSDNVNLQELLPETYKGEMADDADAMLMIARKP